MLIVVVLLHITLCSTVGKQTFDIWPLCGRDEQLLPSRETVADVIAIASEFWKRHPQDHIAIHCAYGQSSVFCPASLSFLPP